MVITPSVNHILTVSIPLSFPLLSVVSLHISSQILYILLLFSFPALFSACLYVLSFLKSVLLHYILYVSIIGPFSRSLSPLIFLMLCTCFPISLHYRYTLLMLYCISVRLFDSSIPCRLTISLFLYIPIYYAYSCILSFQHYHSIVISFSRLKSIAISVIPRIFLQILCNIRKWSQESLSDFLEPV